MKRARVIVSTYNNVPHLNRVLRGYLRQTSKDFALTIADDGSTEETAEFIRAFTETAGEVGIPVSHVWHEDDGFRKCRILNEAVRRSEGEPLLLFSDGDCVPPAHFVETHLSVHEPWSFHVGGRYLLSQEVSAGLDEAAIDAGAFESLVTAEHRRDVARRFRKSRWGTMLRRKNRPKILGVNMGFDRALLEAINGFDERFEGWGLGEDSDLRDRAMRLRPRPKVKNLYGRCDVFHIWHPSVEGATRRGNWDYYSQPRPVRCEVGLVQDPEPAQA